jgi:hypothetical protein
MDAGLIDCMMGGLNDRMTGAAGYTVVQSFCRLIVLAQADALSCCMRIPV